MIIDQPGGGELRDRLGTLAEILPVIVWSADADGTVDFVSQDFYRLTGLAELDLTADAWLEALHPDDREPIMAVWRDAVERGETYHTEFRIQSDDGEYRWHLVEARPQHDDGWIIRWFGTAVDIHDRKCAEARAESEEHLSRLLLECSGEGIHGIDREGRIIFENAVALQMLGYGKDKLFGKPAHQTIHHHTAAGGEYPVEKCPIYKSLEDGRRRYVNDEVFFRRDGTAFPVAYTASPIRDSSSGEISGVVVNFRDTSQNVRDKKLARLESDVLDRISAGQSLQRILDSVTSRTEDLMPDALASIQLIEDNKLRHASAPSLPEAYNRAIDGLEIGATAGSCGTAAFTGKPVIVNDIGNDPRWASLRDLAADHGLAACWSMPVFDAAGNVLATFALYYREVREPNDNDLILIERIARYVGLAIERVREAERLRENEKRFRLLARATSDVVWDWNLITDRVWWNEDIEERFGYRRDELPADTESWTRMIHPEDRDRVLAGIDSAIRSVKAQWTDEYRVICADGSEVLTEDRGHLIKDSSGRPIRMVGSMVDITKVRQLERQLSRAQRLEAIGQLTGGVAHDFNNLLTVIMGNSELLLDELDDDAHRSLVETVYSAAERGSELTSRLLAFARRQALAPEPVEVNRLISDIDHMLRRTLGENIEIEFVRGAGLWPAMVDAAQLENALLNLSLNARDATPEGGCLTIETANAKLDDEYAAQSLDVTPGRYVMVAVSDTGTGMDQQTLDQAFEPFFTTKDSGKGSGLGLSMVYGFAKQSQGYIRIYSEPGEGTTVKLYLPRADGERTRNPKPVEREAQNTGGSETILVVEDNELVRQHVEKMLASLGYEVVSASDGNEALSLIEGKDNIDLLFTDVVMPGGLSGRQVADKARATRPDLPVLFTSGYTENAIVHQGRLDEGVHLLQKPYRREELATKIRKVMAENDSS